jgi:hypothetical protein
MVIEIQKAHGFAWGLVSLKDDGSLVERGDHASSLARTKISYVAMEINADRGKARRLNHTEEICLLARQIKRREGMNVLGHRGGEPYDKVGLTQPRMWRSQTGMGINDKRGQLNRGRT